MHPIYNYDLYIFDCDGVIFDSNYLKIEAMRNILSAYPQDKVELCIKYFSDNFGKSRYHHVEYFLKNIFNEEGVCREEKYKKLLEEYSGQCKKVYLSAKMSPGFIQFLEKLNAFSFVASGSDESELKEAFNMVGISDRFKGIYGSPETKSNNVKTILKENVHEKAVMIGDSFSDLESAEENEIDFVFYSPYSNVKSDMERICKHKKYRILESFDEV